MATKNKKNEKGVSYPQEIRKLKGEGPRRVYLLWGQEDYLREQFFAAIKKICIPDGEDSFSYKRMDGPELDLSALQEAVDAVPFLSERSLVELRDVDINRLKEPQALEKILRDVPDYCTVCFVQSSRFEPDGRVKSVKVLRELAEDLCFSSQKQGDLIDWISRRFAAAGKGVEFEAAQRLLFISGDLMSRLIPEIEKVAAYAKGDKVTVADVDAVAHHIPEAEIFEMTELLSEKKVNAAINSLTEILAENGNDPILLLAILGSQMRKLYAARLAVEKGLGTKYIMDTCGIKLDFVARKLLQAARGFTSERLREAIILCAEADYLMKSSGGDSTAILIETVSRIASEE